MLASPGHGWHAPDQPSRFYLLHQFFLQQGTQLARAHAYFRDALIPALARHGAAPGLFLEAVVAHHQPQAACLLPCASWEDIWRIQQLLAADNAFTQSFAAWEQPAQPHDHYSTTLLEAAAYSPAFPEPASSPPRLFELRVYHSPTHRQLSHLHARFAGPEMAIFHRLGIHPILYASALTGPQRPNLVYLTPFDSLAAREQCWTAFAADPDWIRLREQTTTAHGQIANVISIALYRAAPYSPVR